MIVPNNLNFWTKGVIQFLSAQISTRFYIINFLDQILK